MLKKRAQGMSMNIIVVAAIALIILVVLVVIFVGRSSKFTAGISECSGDCVETKEACEAQGEFVKVDKFAKCTKQDGSGDPDLDRPVCCVSVV